MVERYNLEEMYLDWFNNFTSVECFAEYYNVTEIEAHDIITAGRKLHMADTRCHTGWQL